MQGTCDVGALPDVYSGYQKVTDAPIREKFEKAWGVKDLPGEVGLGVTTAVNAAAEGKLKAVFIMGENPMISGPDQNHVRKALEKLKFLVVQDLFLTPPAELPDDEYPFVLSTGRNYFQFHTGTMTRRSRLHIPGPGPFGITFPIALPQQYLTHYCVSGGHDEVADSDEMCWT